MNVLVVGSGGREHALAWKAAQSTQVETVFVAPGNAGTATEANLQNVAIAIDDFAALADFARGNNVGLTIVGPEQPLVDGLVDFFNQRGCRFLALQKARPSWRAQKRLPKTFYCATRFPPATIKISPISTKHWLTCIKWAHRLLSRPTVSCRQRRHCRHDIEEAEAAVRDMLAGNAFGEAGHRVVIEEFLDGEEASFIVMVDGKNVLPMATSQDHKRVGDGDTGVNTGGMGAYSPAPVVR